MLMTSTIEYTASSPIIIIITYAGCIAAGAGIALSRVCLFVCLSVCLFVRALKCMVL